MTSLTELEENSETISTRLSVSSSTPEEAVKNIDNADLYDMQPEAYKEVSVQLDKEVEDIKRVPAQLDNGVTEFLNQDSEQLAASQLHLSTFDDVAKRLQWRENTVNVIPEKNRRISELNRIKMFGGSLSEDESDELEILNTDIEDMQARKPENISFIEELSADMGAGLTGMIHTYTDNIKTLLGFTTAGAIYGGGVGSTVPGAGTVGGAVTGAITGFTTGATVVGFIDGFNETSGLMYNSLSRSRDDQGKPLNLSQDKLRNVSVATGLISGAISALSSKVFVSNNPILKQFTSPKIATKFLMKSPQLLAKMDIIGGVIKSALTEGSEEFAQEIISIVGENFATLDDSEEGFSNTLDNIGNAVGQLNQESLKQAGYAGLVGVGVSAGIQGGQAPFARKGLEAKYEKQQKRQNDRKEVLENQNLVLEISEQIRQAKSKGLKDKVVDKFVRHMYDFVDVDQPLYITKEDAEKFADTPEKQEAVSEFLAINKALNDALEASNNDPEGDLASAIKLVTEFPEASDMLRTKPDGESPIEARDNINELDKRIEETRIKADEILSELDSSEEISQEVATKLEELAADLKDPRPFEDEFDYLDSLTVTETEGVLTKEQANNINVEFLEAKLSVSEELRNEANEEFDVIEGRIARDVKSKTIKEQIKKHETNLHILDRFKDTKNKSEAAVPTLSKHETKGFSPSAIDPKSLDEAQREIFLKNKALKKRKVFVEGGLTLDESAVINGVESGDKLLEILADTPTKTELKKLKDSQKGLLENRIRQDTLPARKSKVDKAFSKLSDIYVKQLNFMKNKSWPTMKRGIIKINKTPLTVAALKQEAVSLVNGMKLRNLNPNKFLQGERRSKDLSMKQFLEGKIEQSYGNLEKAALNNEIRREAIKAKVQVDKNKKFWKDIKSKTNQKTLADAGYLEAVNELVDTFRLEGETKGVKQLEIYVAEQKSIGNPTNIDTESIQDVRVPLNEMTVDQYNEVTLNAQMILHHSKMQNKQLVIDKKAAELKTMEHIAEEIQEASESHPGYDPKRLDKDPKNVLATVFDKIGYAYRVGSSSFASLNSIVKELDAEKLGGKFNELIGDPLNKAMQNKRNFINQAVDHDRAVINKFFGSLKNWRDNYNETLAIPEFAGIKELGNGKGDIRKIDLYVLQAYRGDVEMITRFENFTRQNGDSLTIEEIESVLETHLDDNDALFVQNFMHNRFDQFKDQAFEMHERVTGTKPKESHAREFTHRGKVVPGGYFPAQYLPTPDDVKANAFLEKVQEAGLSEEDSALFTKLRASEMTDQTRSKERTGSTRPLSIKFENVFNFTEEYVHDLAFRETTIDTLKIMKNGVNVENMKSIIGQEKYNVLLDTVKDVASKTSDKDVDIFKDSEGMMNGVVKYFNKIHAVKVLGFNEVSMFKQLDSLNTLSLSLGTKGSKYIALRAAKMAANPLAYQRAIDEAIKLNPDVKFEKDNIDSSVIATFSDEFIPTSNQFFTNWKKTGKALNRLQNAKEKYLVNLGFAGLREMDKAIRVTATLAIAEQFHNGDIEGYSSERIAKMTAEQQDKTVKGLIRQITRNTLTASSILDKSPIEKSKMGAVFVRYFTDTRSQINIIMGQGRRIKGHMQKQEYKQAVTQLAYTMVITKMSQMYMNSLSPSKYEEEEKGLLETVTGVLVAPAAKVVDSLPLVGSVKYAVDSPFNSRRKAVSAPVFSTVSDIATTIFALKEMLDVGVTEYETAKQQDIAMLTSFGVLTKGIPSKAIYRMLSEDVDSESEFDSSSSFKNNVTELGLLINEYVEKFKYKPEAEEFIKDIKDFQKLLPQDEESIESLIDEDTQPIFKDVLSGGKWSKIDPDTGAAGTYQFTEERWNLLMESEPDLGLTENGRVSKNQDEQEIAMEFSLKENALTLHNNRIELTNVNLLGSHIFGVDNMITIQEHSRNTKLSKILGNASKNAPLSEFKTVGSVLKHLSKLMTN